VNLSTLFARFPIEAFLDLVKPFQYTFNSLREILDEITLDTRPERRAFNSLREIRDLQRDPRHRRSGHPFNSLREIPLLRGSSRPIVLAFQLSSRDSSAFALRNDPPHRHFQLSSRDSALRSLRRACPEEKGFQLSSRDSRRDTARLTA